MHSLAAHRSRLPWLAALAASLVHVLLFLVNVSLLYARPTPLPPSLVVPILLLPAAAGLLARAWLTFLIVQWQGETRGPLAVRRPVLLLLVFALMLLVWMFAVGMLYGLLMPQIATATSARLASGAMVLLAPLSDAAGIWLAWRLATGLLRNDALPPQPQPAMTLRAAGLIVAGLAVLLAHGAPFAVSATHGLLGNDSLGLLAAMGAALLVLGLAFAGTMPGLGRDQARVHGGRVLLVTLLAPLSIGLWTYGWGRLLVHVLMPALDLPVIAAGWILLALLCLGIVGAYGLWARVFYTGVPRLAAARAAVPPLPG